MSYYEFIGDKKELKKHGYTYFSGNGNGSRYFKRHSDHSDSVFIFNRGNMIIYQGISYKHLSVLFDYINVENPSTMLFVSNKGNIITKDRKDQIDEDFYQEMLNIEKKLDEGIITKEEEKVLIKDYFTRMKANEFNHGDYISLTLIIQIKELFELGIEKKS